MARQRMAQASLGLNLISIPAAVFGHYDITGNGQIVHNALHRAFRYTNGRGDLSHAYIRLLCDQREYMRVIGEHGNAVGR